MGSSAISSRKGKRAALSMQSGLRGPTQCRLLTGRVHGTQTLLTGITVLKNETGARRLMIIIDDYMVPSPQWCVYGFRTEQALKEMGYAVGGTGDSSKCEAH
jgi:hypothetical protein